LRKEHLLVYDEKKEFTMFGIQPIHIVIVVAVAFLIFGGAKLPEMGRSLGRSISEFRKGTKEAAEGFKDEIAGTENAPATSSAPARAAATLVTSAAAAGGVFCIRCDAPNPAEARFCASCGTKLPENVS
jgi:TatA/E family protein of Tat protein translocase